jgi:hypothetical protein
MRPWPIRPEITLQSHREDDIEIEARLLRGVVLSIIAEGHDRMGGSETQALHPAPGLQFQILEKINPLQTTLI